MSIMETTTPVGSTSDWPGSPLSTLHELTQQVRSIPVEQYPNGTSYVVRFEIPGVDPARDLTVSVQTGTLTVRAEHRQDGPDDEQSEFQYGSFARCIALPLGVDISDVSATCHNGILTVRIGMRSGQGRDARQIEVTVEP
jgi:HSP20 family protein